MFIIFMTFICLEGGVAADLTLLNCEWDVTVALHRQAGLPLLLTSEAQHFYWPDKKNFSNSFPHTLAQMNFYRLWTVSERKELNYDHFIVL